MDFLIRHELLGSPPLGRAASNDGGAAVADAASSRELADQAASRVVKPTGNAQPGSPMRIAGIFHGSLTCTGLDYF